MKKKISRSVFDAAVRTLSNAPETFKAIRMISGAFSRCRQRTYTIGNSAGSRFVAVLCRSVLFEPNRKAERLFRSRNFFGPA